jgi:WS/DGAT/MGAT family acyltransferase
MEQMSSLDASFLDFEDSVTHMHVGSIAIFEGPAPQADELRAMVLCKLDAVPRYRQIVSSVPLHAGRPVWIDDRHFNIDYHVRRTALPEPGGEEQLRLLVGRVMSQQLDRHKPLWEMWAADGLGDGRWALISKVHHCMVDGIAATDLLTAMLDRERSPQLPEPESWTPTPAPGGAELVLRSLAGEVRDPLAAATRLLLAPRALVQRARQTGGGLLRLRDVVGPGSDSSLNGYLGPHRRWSFARARLADVKEVRAAFGGTVNDVVLACIAGGFREMLLTRGEPLDGGVRTMVPVSVRSAGERGVYNNRVSAVFAQLPVELEDPVARLRAVTAQMDKLKQSNEAVAGEVLTSLAGFAPPLLLALAERLATRVPQRNINTVTTNVPGPQHPLYVGGKRMLEAFPYVPLGGHVRVGVAIFSYDGGLTFGVTGDFDCAPDVDVLCCGIESGMAAVLRAAAGAGAKARTPAEPARTNAKA